MDSLTNFLIGQRSHPPPVVKCKAIPVILNPAARGDRAARLHDELAALSPNALIWLTRERGDAQRFAERAVAEGFDTVVAAGGDGTINEVANGIAGSDTTLGLLPLGTMNVYASELGLPSKPLRRCWEIIEAGKTREVDLALANGRYFVQLAGIGFDAQATERVKRADKRAFGPLSYLMAASHILTSGPRPVDVTVESECGRTETGRFALVGNGRYYGGKLRLFKDARLDDGMLDVVVFKRLSHFDLLRYFRGVLFSDHHNFTDVRYFQTSRLTVRAAESKGRVPFEADGEFAGEAPVEFSVAEKKLRVIVA